MTAVMRSRTRLRLVQTPEPERHEGAITEPIEGQPLREPPERESLPPEPAASRPHEESEPHEGAITEPGEGAASDPTRLS